MDLRRPDSGFYTPDPIIHLRQTGTASAHTAEGQKPEADSVLGEMKGAEQMRNARNRALSLLCAGAILVSAIPVRASAAVSDAVEGTLIQGVEGSIRIYLGDASIDGTKTVRLSGYMEPIPDAYVEDGLVLRLDGLEGADAEAGTWTNLAGSRDPVYENNDIVYINRPEVDKVTGEGTNYFEGNGLVLDNSKVYLPACVAEAVNGDAYTVEYFVDSEGYSGNERAYSPLLTVDETADSWSIFTRTPGSTMELKQGANARLKVSFESALGAPSAVVFDKASGTATWYLDGTAKGQVNAANPAAAEQVILGGRLADNSGKPGPAYQTEAKYYSVRVYNRALSTEELRTNALRDHSRFLGESGLPDLKVKGGALDESGTTQVSLDFTDGVALLPVQSGTLGTLSLKLSVDSTDIPVELETVTPVEAVKDLAAEAMEITVASSATEWDVRAAVEDELKSVLAGSYFLTQGGAIVVSGTESGGFTAKLFLKDDKATVTLQVTVHRSASTDFDALKPYFIRVMQGTFRFDSAEAVTADAIVQQVSALLEDEAVTPSARWEEEEGCWMLTLDQGEKSASLPLYINSEVSYDFDDADLLNYCTLRMAGDDYARISGGALEVSGTVGNTYENVVFPVWNFGRDFCIEAEVQLKSAVNDSRWMAVSYGLNPSGDDYQYTFWQMAVRQNATASNGVECANMANGWNVTHTASYGEAISPDKTYKLTILYKDGVVYEYINEEFMIKSERIPAAGADGKIAFTYDRLNAEVKSLRVTSDLPDLPTEKPLAENGYDTDVYEPVTDLVMAPTVVAENSGESAAAVAAGERRPATLVREVAEELTVEDNGEHIALSEYMTRLEKKALAGFRIEDGETAAAFAQYASENSLVDVTVFSTASEVLKTACAGVPGIRGVLDFTGDMPEKTIDVVFDTNRSGARIALIPAFAATRETVRYIQARAVTVWVQASEDEMDAAILAGADGIVTDDWTAVLGAIEAYSSGEQVLTRPTVIVAHRGFHETAPENSERAARLAVEAGADAIECDVYLSSDGYVMINHDDTTGRLMNKDLNVSSSTKAELQALTFTVGTAQEGDKMPTLEELFAAADAADPDDDIIHVIEIKSSAPELIDPLIQVIKDCGMEDRVVFISFHDEQIKRIREKMHEISVGELNSCTNSGNDLATNIKGLSDRLAPLNAFYNCNYGAQTEELVQAARHRGIYVHPWTVDDQSTFEQEFGDGYHGITSDRVDYATDYLSGLTVESASVTVKTGEANAAAVAANEVRRSGSTPVQQVGFRQLSGVKVRQDDQGRFWAEQAGVAVIALSATDTLPASGETYTVYSDPIAVTFTKDSGSSDKDDDDDDTKPVQPDQPDTTPDTKPTQPDTTPDTASQETVRFSDVPETYWGYSAIQKLVALQVVNGTGNGTFEPEKSVTRAEFVTMLSRLSGDAPGQGSARFRDVAQDAWYASAVAWAVENGITTGTSETTFAPDAPISRQDIAVMLYRFLNARGISLNKGGTAGQFLDVNEISSYAAEAVEYVRRSGVVNGRPDGSFAPLDSASRAETCSMLAGIADAVRS